MSHAVHHEAGHRPIYLLAILIAMLLSGCGKKGPLYVPDKKPAPSAPVTAPVYAPAGTPQP